MAVKTAPNVERNATNALCGEKAGRWEWDLLEATLCLKLQFKIVIVQWKQLGKPSHIYQLSGGFLK